MIFKLSGCITKGSQIISNLEITHRSYVLGVQSHDDLFSPRSIFGMLKNLATEELSILWNTISARPTGSTIKISP